MANQTKTVDPTALKGNERALCYKVYPMPSDKKRFSFTWNVFKNKMGRLVFTNLLALIFFIPVVALLILRFLSVSGSVDLGNLGDLLGIVYLGAGNLGLGYPVSTLAAGVIEKTVMHIDLVFFGLMIACSFVTAIGVSGAMYCARRFLRAEEEFRFFGWFIDFFRGVKHGYFSALLSCVASFAAILGGVYFWDFASYQMAVGGNLILWWALRVLLWLAVALVVVIALWFFAIGSNYKTNFKGLLQHTFYVSFSAMVQTVVCLSIGALPAVLLLLGDMMVSFVYAYFLLVGFAAEILIFASLGDWAFDSYADFFKVQTAIREQQEAESRKEAPLSEQEKMRMLRLGGKSVYLSKAIQPFDQGMTPVVVGENFTEKDLEVMQKNKEELKKEAKAYAEKYANEEKYKTYNTLFDEKEKMLQAPKKGKKMGGGMLS